MSKVIDRIRAKVTRAKQHIRDFQLALRTFYDTNPYAIGIKEDPQAGQRTYYVTKADPVPDSLTAVATDVIQNLRAPLDHIAYQLVLDALGGVPPPNKREIHFPICGIASEYPSLRGRNIKPVRQEIIDTIDATEPYKGGKGHALWQLNELNKIDKHHLLIGAGTFYAGVVSLTIKDRIKAMLQRAGHDASTLSNVDKLIQPIILLPADKLLSLQVGNELYREPLHHEMHKDRRFTFEVSFNEPGVIQCEPALKTRQDVANLVDEIITKLGRFLP
jgi:hypothetical protein